MIASLIEQIAKAITAGANIAQPLIESYNANRFERYRDELAQEWDLAAASPDNGDDVLFVERVLREAGHPVGLVSPCDLRAVPTSHLNQLVAASIDLAALKRELAAAEQALRVATTPGP